MNKSEIKLSDLKETFEVYMSEGLIRAWELYPDDKPARRQYINNYADSLIIDYRDSSKLYTKENFDQNVKVLYDFMEFIEKEGYELKQVKQKKEW